jgi:hypothetical protein
MALAALPSRQPEYDILCDLEMWKERPFLCDIAYPPLFGRKMHSPIGHDAAVNLDAAGIGALEAADQAEQGRLAATRGTEDRQQSA